MAYSKFLIISMTSFFACAYDCVSHARIKDPKLTDSYFILTPLLWDLDTSVEKEGFLKIVRASQVGQAAASVAWLRARDLD